MIRVMWEEWRGGSLFSAKLLGWFALGIVLALLVLQFQPGSVLIVLCLGALAGGFLSGGQHWNHSADDWRVEGVPAWQYALGKAAGALVLNFAWALLVAPPLMLLMLSWGMPVSAAASALAWVASGCLAAQALTHAVARTPSSGGRVVAGILLVLWLGGGLMLAAVRPIHPLWQIWKLFHDPELPFDALAWLELLGASALLWAVAVLRLRMAEA